MAEKKELYSIHGPDSLADLATQLNMILQRLAARLDKIEAEIAALTP